MPDITNYWLHLVDSVLRQPGDYLTSSGRKYISNFYLEIPGSAWEEGFRPSLVDLGYGGKSSTKFNQLSKTYLNRPAVEAAMVRMRSRVETKKDFTSVAISTFAGAKDSRSQGHCMNSIVLTYIPRPADGKTLYYIDVHYRQTEIIKKFGADLLFLSEVVVPMLELEGVKITAVRFFFSNVFFSALFIAILYPWLTPQELWRKIDKSGMRAQDRSFRKACARYIFWPLENDDPNTYNFRSRRKMHEMSLKYLNDGTVNRESLAELYLDVKNTL